jgi:hypothetical protein
MWVARLLFHGGTEGIREVIWYRTMRRGRHIEVRSQRWLSTESGYPETSGNTMRNIVFGVVDATHIVK